MEPVGNVPTWGKSVTEFRLCEAIASEGCKLRATFLSAYKINLDNGKNQSARAKPPILVAR